MVGKHELRPLLHKSQKRLNSDRGEWSLIWFNQKYEHFSDKMCSDENFSFDLKFMKILPL